MAPRRGSTLDEDVEHEWTISTLAWDIRVRSDLSAEGWVPAPWNGCAALRAAAHNLRAAGVPEEIIMRIAGWKTSNVFKRYAIVDRADIFTC